ncbi:MAG: hypothetical protein ILP22_06150, partial [Oscillospiraceae bacterium]|nr:hypothetical protein [Oscillospiraceae bacterium]
VMSYPWFFFFLHFSFFLFLLFQKKICCFSVIFVCEVLFQGALRSSFAHPSGALGPFAALSGLTFCLSGFFSKGLCDRPLYPSPGFAFVLAPFAALRGPSR